MQNLNNKLHKNASNTMHKYLYSPSALYTRDKISLSSGSFTSTCIPIPIKTNIFINHSNIYFSSLSIFFCVFYLEKVVQNHQIWHHKVQFCSVLKIKIGKLIRYFKSTFVSQIIHRLTCNHCIRRYLFNETFSFSFRQMKV